MKTISYSLNIVFFLVLLYFLSLIVRVKTDNYISQQEKYKSKRLFDLQDYFERNSIDSLSNTFPYESYLDNDNYKSIQAIKNDLAQLDKLNSSERYNRKVLALTLTHKLSNRISYYFNTYQPDSLLRLIQWAERFYNYSEIDPSNSVFYQSIYQFWLDTISNTLHKFSYANASLKYDFKFDYVQTRLKEKGSSPDIKKTSLEKVVDNSIHSKWGHLINASWNQTSMLQKTVVFIFLIISLYGFICIIQKTLKIKA